ncbi:ATP-binding cassette sub-family C member Sur, partial [Dissostichus eleginoides]
SKTHGSGAPPRPEPRTHPKQPLTHRSAGTPLPRSAATQPRLEARNKERRMGN